MPRDGSNIYTQPFPDVVTDTTIESLVYNGFTHDVAIDLNTPRPIISGGTGANNVRDAMINLSGETAKQVVTNYDMQPFLAGSFYSLGSATAGPVDSHAFVGICYLKDDNNIVLEARDQGDTIVPGRLYVREKKAGVWSAWTQNSGVVINDGGEVVLPPVPPPVAPDDATNKAYVDAADAALAAAIEAGDAALGVYINAANDNANNRVSRAGDTMTGGLNAPYFNSINNIYHFGSGANYLNYTGTFNFTAGLTCGSITCGGISANGTINTTGARIVSTHSGDSPSVSAFNIARGTGQGFWTGDRMYFGQTDTAGTPGPAWFNATNADFRVVNAAGKPGGGGWYDTSDARIKNILGDYTSGLDAVTALQPVRYTFKGNDTEVPPSNSPVGVPPDSEADREVPTVPYPNSFHYGVAMAQKEFVGLIAQQAEVTMPELVTQAEGYIDGAAVTDLRNVDNTPLVYALINSIKELKARIEALEAA